jgi:pimeloyl-ACP methyl ester carboxylesterase
MKKISILLLLMSTLVLTNSCIVVVKELLPAPKAEGTSPDIVATVPLTDEPLKYDYFTVQGYQEPHTPPLVEPTESLRSLLMRNNGSIDLNRSAVVEVTHSEFDSETVLVFIPGIFAGAGSLLNLGTAVAARMPDDDIWLWERRTNFLEDRKAIVEAYATGEYEALTRLWGEPGKNGIRSVRDDVFYQPAKEDIPFVGHWGVELMLRDLHEVVLAARERYQNVVLVGYSLGALYLSTYLAMEIETDGEKILYGNDFVDSIIYLDGPPMLAGYAKRESQYLNGVFIIPFNRVNGLRALEAGTVYPSNATISREFSTLFAIDLSAAMAITNPTATHINPYRASGRNWPVSNLAQYFLFIDDNYQNIKLFTGSFGRAKAKQNGKFEYYSQVKVKGADESGRIDWESPSEANGEWNEPLEYLAAGMYTDFNLSEWYQPTRIMLDFGTIAENDTSTGWQSKYFSITGTKYIDKPVLAIGLARGLAYEKSVYENFLEKTSVTDASVHVIGDLTHLDGSSMTDTNRSQTLADMIANWIAGKPLYRE